jgi:hypothetical protein
MLLNLRPGISVLRFIGVMFCLLAALWTVGCNGGSSSPPPLANPVPSLASGSLNPSSATAGGAGFTLTITGSNFVSASVVQWNGSPRTTTYVSSTSLQAAIGASDIATTGSVSITVVTPAPGGGTSNALTVMLDNPVPALTSINPSSALGSTGAFTLSLIGTSFVSSSVVQWNGSTGPTTYTAIYEKHLRFTVLPNPITPIPSKSREDGSGTDEAVALVSAKAVMSTKGPQ